MKFISKSLNYRIVLRPGIQGDSMIGRAAVPGVYVKFEDGIVDVKNEEHIKLLLASDKFNIDFIAADEVSEAIKNYRSGAEPEHDMVNIEYGHVGKNANPRGANSMTPDLRKMITEMAAKMATEMASKMAVEMSSNLIKQMIEEGKVPSSSNPEKIEEPEEEKESTDGEEKVAGIVEPNHNIEEEAITKPKAKGGNKSSK